MRAWLRIVGLCLAWVLVLPSGSASAGKLSDTAVVVGQARWLLRGAPCVTNLISGNAGASTLNVAGSILDLS